MSTFAARRHDDPNRRSNEAAQSGGKSPAANPCSLSDDDHSTSRHDQQPAPMQRIPARRLCYLSCHSTWSRVSPFKFARLNGIFQEIP
jgi:hypothetical protein